MQCSLILVLLSFPGQMCGQYFNNPESVVYDTLNNRYLISNVGSGNIVQIENSGDTSFFSTVLTRTLGLVIVGDILFVTDFSGVVGFDLTTDQIVMTIPIPGMDILNDITADTSGYLFVTDSGNGNIYRVKISNQSSETIVSSIYWPNGILYDEYNNRIIFCAFGSNVPIRAIDIENFSVSTVTTTNFSDLDGLSMDGGGYIYVSSWGSGSVYRYDNAFSSQPELISSGHNGPADIFYNKINNVLVVPNFNDNTVDFIPVIPNSLVENNSPPQKFELSQNFPNPFNPTTKINYYIPEGSFVSLKVYDVLGNEIIVLVNEELQAGHHEIEFNGNGLSNGVYIYQINANDIVETKKMILIK
ncbi:T9SS type A sorting domain-containing protein [Bacteroidota bacterium]